MTQQELVETICTQTGISKRDLARWIGTDHSVLCRYTAGTRSLPLRPMQQLLFLHQQLSDLPPLPPVVVQPGTTDVNWQQQANECAARLQSLQTKQETMQQNRANAAKALQLLAMLAADTVMLTPARQRWIAEQQYQAEKLATDNTLTDQQKLQVQVALLQKEIELYEALAKLS